jgi:hypothetical protein
VWPGSGLGVLTIQEEPCNRGTGGDDGEHDDDNLHDRFDTRRCRTSSIWVAVGVLATIVVQ